MRRIESELAVKLTERSSGELVTLLASTKVRKGLAPILQAVRELARLVEGEMDGESYSRWAARFPLKIATIERFLETADQGSINRAARRLRLGQPQLSLQIANLEDFLGRKLFERLSQGSVLTDEGRRVYAIFASIAEAWRELKSSADDRYRRSARALRIGSIIPTGSESWVARCLGSLVAQWNAGGDRNAISLVLMTADDLREALISGRIDVAILDSIFGLDNFRHRELIATDMVAIAPMSSREETVADLVASHPLCTPSSRTGLGHAAMAYSDERGEDRRRASRDITAADSLPVIVDLVANHGYVSFLGRASALPIAGRVRIVELGEIVAMSYHVAYNHRQASADACELIVRAVREIVGSDEATQESPKLAGAQP